MKTLKDIIKIWLGITDIESRLKIIKIIETKLNEITVILPTKYK